MKLVAWNINSVRLRLPLLAQLIDDVSPDVICLQETKVADQLFPAADIAALGYPHQAFRGMKSYNGVAILSRAPFEDTGGRDWCGKQDCRHVSAGLTGGVELHNFYVPAGGDEPDPEINDKFDHKLKFVDAAARWCRRRRDPAARRILVGDFNIAPLETDVWSHKQLLKVVSHTPIEVKRLSSWQKSGPWVDAMRHFVPPEEKLYTWWSYRAPDWEAADRGRRLDHIWVSEALAPELANMEVLRDYRGREKPSDHVPVVVTLKD